VERALTLYPNLATAWEYSGAIRAWLRLRQSRLDPLMPRQPNMIGFSHFIAGRYNEALRSLFELYRMMMRAANVRSGSWLCKDVLSRRPVL
jgi:hypothetical protein